MSVKDFADRAQRFVMTFGLTRRIVYRAWMEDEAYLRMEYRKAFGAEPDLVHPKNFNEKNNWRKLHDRQPIYTSMVDKYKVKQVIADKVGAEHAFPLLGVWDKPEKIDFDALPEQFVLKPTHGSGVKVCRDKASFDRKKAMGWARRRLRSEYYLRFREWPYKNVERKIIAEQYMGEDLVDYKNYCFNGKLMYTFVWQNQSFESGNKPKAHFCGAYDRSWVKTDLEIDYPTDDVLVEKPSGYKEMVIVAEKMAEGIPFVRVDCYVINGQVYVGEMTFFPWAGFQKFKSEKWNERLGEMEKLLGIDY